MRILTQFFYKLHCSFRDIIKQERILLRDVWGENFVRRKKKKKMQDWGKKQKKKILLERGWESFRNSCRKMCILLPRNKPRFLRMSEGEESFRTLVETTRFPMKEINKTQALKTYFFFSIEILAFHWLGILSFFFSFCHCFFFDRGRDSPKKPSKYINSR